MIDTLPIEIQKTANSRIHTLDEDNIPFGKLYSDHMFVADFVAGEWKNFKIMPYGDLKMSPATSTIHYGQSIFEGLKAYKMDNGEYAIFRPDANFERMNVSAERMCIPAIPEELFMGGLTELLKMDKAWIPKKKGTSLYIRPFVFATDEYIGIRPSSNFKFMIITCPVGSYYSEPVRVRIETKFTRAAAGGTGYAKAAGNYAGSLYPAGFAQREGYHQLIWTDHKEHKYIEESGTMNVMFVIGDTIITPAPSETILNGITRRSVVQIAKDWGLKVEERKVTVEEVIQAAKSGQLKEAFGAGTAATIAQIAVINHEGVDYELPAIAQREFSNKVLTHLDGIKAGSIADQHGWLFKF